MAGSTHCWWCKGWLVGLGGVKGKEPLFYKVVFDQLGNKVRVHKTCQKDAQKSMITAQPRSTR